MNKKMGWPLLLALAACDPASTLQPSADIDAGRAPAPVTTSQEWVNRCSPDLRTCLTVKLWVTGTAVKVHAWNLSGGPTGGYRGMMLTSLSFQNVPDDVAPTVSTVPVMSGPIYVKGSTPAKWRLAKVTTPLTGAIELSKPQGSNHLSNTIASNCASYYPSLIPAGTNLWMNRTCGSGYVVLGSSLKAYAVEMTFNVTRTFDARQVALAFTAIDELGVPDAGF